MQDLQHSQTPIIDIAIKYGHDSTAAFSRAFAKQHGITPSVYCKDGGLLKVYSPASFHIIISRERADVRPLKLETRALPAARALPAGTYAASARILLAEAFFWSSYCIGDLNNFT